MTDEKGNTLFAPKTVGFVEYFLPGTVAGPEHVIDRAYLLESLYARINREDVVLAAGLNKEGAGCNQPGNVVHLGPVQNSGNVVIHAVRDAANAVAERVQISAYQRGAYPRLHRRREQG